MKRYSDRRQVNSSQSPRQRAHDVVIWQEQEEWVVYDSVSDKCFRFEDYQEAFQKFSEIKASNREASLL